MNRIKKGDTVKITTGKDRGKTGKVLRVDVASNRAAVEGLNVFKKHSRPRKQGEKGEVVSVARPVALSNLLPVCPSCGTGRRVGVKGTGDARSRVCKKCGTEF